MTEDSTQFAQRPGQPTRTRKTVLRKKARWLSDAGCHHCFSPAGPDAPHLPLNRKLLTRVQATPRQRWLRRGVLGLRATAWREPLLWTAPAWAKGGRERAAPSWRRVIDGIKTAEIGLEARAQRRQDVKTWMRRLLRRADLPSAGPQRSESPATGTAYDAPCRGLVTHSDATRLRPRPRGLLAGAYTATARTPRRRPRVLDPSRVAQERGRGCNAPVGERMPSSHGGSPRGRAGGSRGTWRRTCRCPSWTRSCSTLGGRPPRHAGTAPRAGSPRSGRGSRRGARRACAPVTSARASSWPPCPGTTRACTSAWRTASGRTCAASPAGRTARRRRRCRSGPAWPQSRSRPPSAAVPSPAAAPAAPTAAGPAGALPPRGPPRVRRGAQPARRAAARRRRSRPRGGHRPRPRCTAGLVRRAALPGVPWPPRARRARGGGEGKDPWGKEKG